MQQIKARTPRVLMCIYKYERDGISIIMLLLGTLIKVMIKRVVVAYTNGTGAA